MTARPADMPQWMWSARLRCDGMWRPKVCQWIEGEPLPGDEYKCGEMVVVGQSWCEGHMKRVFVK